MARDEAWRAPRSVLKGLREARVHFGLFDFAIFCITGPHSDVQRYVSWRHKIDYDPPPPLACGLHYEGVGSYCPVIWIQRVPKTPEDYGTLAHEVCHAVREMMMDWAKMPLDKNTQEVFCHAVDHAVKTLATELRR